jgi:hypothetical protein
MSQSDKFRENAADCQEQAEKSITPRDKEQWLKIAEQWLKLAEATDQFAAD